MSYSDKRAPKVPNIRMHSPRTNPSGAMGPRTVVKCHGQGLEIPRGGATTCYFANNRDSAADRRPRVSSILNPAFRYWLHRRRHDRGDQGKDAWQSHARNGSGNWSNSRIGSPAPSRRLIGVLPKLVSDRRVFLLFFTLSHPHYTDVIL